MNTKVELLKAQSVSERKSGWLSTAVVLAWPALAIGTATAFAQLSENGAQVAAQVQWGGTGQILLVAVLGVSLLGLGALIIYARACRRAQRRHIGAEQKAVNFLDIAGSIIVALDTSARVTLINQAGCRVFGYSRDEIIGHDWIDILIAAGQRDEIRAAFKRMLSGDTEAFAHLDNFELLTKDGSVRLISWHNVPVRNERGETTGALCSGEDITDRVRIEQTLRENDEHKAVNYLNIAGSVIVALDTSARVTLINQAGCRVFGYSSNEILGRDWIDTLIPAAQRDKIRASFQRMMSGDTEPFAHLDNFELLVKDGGKRLTSWHNVPIRNERGEITGALCSGEDITKRVRIEEELRENKDRLVQLAHYDYLTKLPNRPLFQDRLKHAIAQAHRTRDQVALLLLDLDRFKNINDTLGHAVGDQYLKVLANRLRSCMREGDTVARLGGDEFVVILHTIANPRDAKVVAEKLLRDLSRPVYVENNELKTTTSIGISFYPSGGSTVEELLKTADAAMYQAKEHGRNNYQFYTEDMNAKAVEWLALETDLQQALDKGQLVIHYQPQYDLATGALVGMEALLRWQHPTRGLMEPRQFIPLAEETGQIVSIGNWVLRTACMQNLKWQEQGYSPIKMAVNLSARQFQQKNLAATVDKILRETGFHAKHLELEFRESSVMEDAETAVYTLIELRCLGISLVVDDFGMGYSSLNHLKRFPLDKLKIDGSFVRRIASDANDAAITAATIALAHNMGLQVIAESVENEIQADFLTKQGCDAAQGYYYSRPKTAEQCTELLNKLGPEQRDRLQLSHPET